MPTADVNTLTLDYDSSGDPAAPALLLIMGLGMPAVAWPEAFVNALAGAGFRVVRFDNRDCGQSAKSHAGRLPSLPWSIARSLLRLKVQAPYTLDDMAADSVGLLDILGIDRAHLVGASMGGMIAQNVAALHPRRVASLTSIMSSTGNPSPRVALGRLHVILALLSRPSAPADSETLLDHYVRVFEMIGSPAFPIEPKLRRQYLERILRRGFHPAGTARQLLAILASGDRRPLLAHIVAPTLVIHGSADPLVPPAAGRDTTQHIRGAQLRIIDGMGHDLPPGVLPMLVEAIVEHCRAADGARAR